MGPFTKISSQRQVPIHKSACTKSLRFLSVARLTRTRIGKENTVKENFRRIVQKFSNGQGATSAKCLLSFLNVFKPVEQIVASMSYIPSIENMISEQHIQDESKFTQGVSNEEDFSSRELLSENNIDMSVLYLCLLDKVMRPLQQYHITPEQRVQIMKGTWNILVKYWKDFNYRCYEGVGEKVEWGLLELIDFNFNVSPKERYEAEHRACHFHETSDKRPPRV